MKRRDSNKGFTLTELLVACAILALITSLAVPSYNTYTARSRQQQAKTWLAAGHVQLNLFYTDTTTYTLCLAHLGFNPASEKLQYYEIGFEGFARAPACGPNGDVPNCDAYKFDINGNASASCTMTMGENAFYNNACEDTATYCGAFGAGLTPLAGLIRLGRDSFTMGACGSVSSNGLDCWTIDQNRTLINNVPGL